MGKAMSSEDQAAVALAMELFAPLGPIRVRRMFGGAGLYLDGVMFALVAFGGLYLKADAATAASFRGAGARQFEYEREGRVVQMGYWTLPERAVDDAEEALAWGRRALEAAQRGR